MQYIAVLFYFIDLANVSSRVATFSCFPTLFPINFELWMMQVKLVSLFLTQTLFPPPTLPGLLLVSFSHFLSLTLRTV